MDLFQAKVLKLNAKFQQLDNKLIDWKVAIYMPQYSSYSSIGKGSDTAACTVQVVIGR